MDLKPLRASSVASFVVAPLVDYLAALDRLLPYLTWLRGCATAAAAFLSWMIYVPFHELAHAYGCILTGGTVTRLEIDPIYGAAWLAEIFPFVAVGSEYAGQLTGFDTGDSDLVYLATDFAPFLLTILLGVPMLRAVPGIANPLARFAVLGASLPVAYAPFISIPGDFYEMGSIVVSRLGAGLAGYPVERWRSDDVFLLIDQLGGSGGGLIDWVAIATASVLGVGLALATYSAGAGVASALQSQTGNRAGISEVDTSE